MNPSYLSEATLFSLEARKRAASYLSFMWEWANFNIYKFWISVGARPLRQICPSAYSIYYITQTISAAVTELTSEI